MPKHKQPKPKRPNFKGWEYYAERRQNHFAELMETTPFMEGDKCRGFTAEGDPCQHAAMRGGYYCKQHQPKAKQ